MQRKILFGWLLISSLYQPLKAFVKTDDAFFYIRNRYYLLTISKFSGMLESAQLLPHSFDIASDYPGYSLFFTEFALQLPDTTGELFDNSERRTLGGTVTVRQFESQNFARLEFVWDNPYITTTWDYNFFADKKYFCVNLERQVKKTAVYANHQQCLMTNSDFDNHYLVNYEGEWFQLMSKGNVAPGAMERSANFQHNMYTAIDRGHGQRFPALGWYQSQADVTFGVIFPTVSANQRASIAYHGGGRTSVPRHPGFSECQLDWFGKADSEALLLVAGTRYSMQMVYYLGIGSIDSLDRFNQDLFNAQHYDLVKCEDYSVASWGGRHAYQRAYTWVYPQATTNYITSQELFEHRAISLPRSQNGSPWPHLFDLRLVHEIYGLMVDLTPVPMFDGQLKVHDAVANRQGADWFEGEVSWRSNTLASRLIYRIFTASDKLTVRGQITTLNRTWIDMLYVDLPFTARVTHVKKLTDFDWDVRASDTLFGEIGITIFDMEGIQAVEKDAFGLRLILNPQAGFAGADTSWEFQFKLGPHLETRVESAGQISAFYSKPDFWYREYYQSFPDLSPSKQWGIHPDNRIVPIEATWCPAENVFFRLQLYAEAGEYPLQLYLAQQQVRAVAVNDIFLSESDWDFYPESSVLQIRRHWQGVVIIELSRESNTSGVDPEAETLARDPRPSGAASSLSAIQELRILPNFPNPFQNQTHWAIRLEKPQAVSVKIYNILGQAVKTFLIDSFLAGTQHFSWDGLNDQYAAQGGGIYWLVVETSTGRYSRKLVLLR
ncbi:T9SS type A sorting domain-containing protein [candidate division KSB1 bacterium]|nr:T9SS type A sorting domain-containing protein [candidate division KSB1 bacterium]